MVLHGRFDASYVAAIGSSTPTLSFWLCSGSPNRKLAAAPRHARGHFLILNHMETSRLCLTLDHMETSRLCLTLDHMETTPLCLTLDHMET